MGKCAYAVTVVTREAVSDEHYAKVSEMLVAAFASTLGPHTFRTVMNCHSGHISDARIEVEVEGDETVSAMAVVIAESEEKLNFDKSKFTQLFRAAVSPLEVTVTKRVIPKEELEAYTSQ